MGDIFLSDCAYRVTYVSNNTSILCLGGSEEKLVSGTVIGLNALIRTNFSYVEIKNSHNQTFRLAPHSEFCLENTIEGIAPVYYGDIQFYSLCSEIIRSGGKYRTSCWITKTFTDHDIHGSQKFAIERYDHASDVYYSFDNGYDIYEYDELGEKYTITSLSPFQKCILQYDFSKNMKSRYKVLTLEPLKSTDLCRLFKTYHQNFLVPNHSSSNPKGGDYHYGTGF